MADNSSDMLDCTSDTAGENALAAGRGVEGDGSTEHVVDSTRQIIDSEVDMTMGDLKSGLMTVASYIETAGLEFPWIDHLIENLIERSGIHAHPSKAGEDVAILQPLLVAPELRHQESQKNNLEQCFLYYLLSIEQILAGNSGEADSIVTEQERIEIACMRSKDFAVACRRLWKREHEGRQSQASVLTN